VAQARADARRLLAAGDDLTPELARLLREIDFWWAGVAVQNVLPVADAEEIEVESWRRSLRNDLPAPPNIRSLLEERAARGDRAAARALADHR
jgi:hypothetical protein